MHWIFISLKFEILKKRKTKKKKNLLVFGILRSSRSKIMYYKFLLTGSFGNLTSLKMTLSITIKHKCRDTTYVTNSLRGTNLISG